MSASIFRWISDRTLFSWPDLAQIRQATIGIIVVVLVIGLLIALLDVALQGVLVRLLPSLFGR